MSYQHPNDLPVIRNARGQVLCGAKKRNGERCKQWAMQNGRCRMHGGTAVVGPGNPAYKHGRYSKALPKRLRERAEEALEDPNLLALVEGVAALDARITDLFSRVDENAGAEAWQLLQEYLAEADRALRRQRPDVGLARDQIALAVGVVRDGLAESALWRDVLDTMEQRRRLVDSEVRRRKDMDNYVTAEQALVFVHAVVETVRQHVDDHDVLSKISADLRRLAAGDGGRAN